MVSYDIYKFNYYSLEGLLNRLYSLNIGVKKYYVIDECKYYVKIERKYRKIIKENFNDFSIEEKIGFINFFEKIILKPITLISLLLAICLFLNLSNRIYKIDIIGDYPFIENRLREYLKEKGIDEFRYGLNEDNLKEIEIKLKEEFNNELEFIEVVKTGGVISLNYKKRRKKLIIDGKKGSLYASKDGVIRGFQLLSGVKNVKLYQYVKKGDLLVTDILVTSNNETIVIGSIGKVFASTFYYVEVETKLDMDIASKQAYLLNMARNEISKNINSNDEYIESENVLVNDLNNGYMKIYYVLYEDITI